MKDNARHELLTLREAADVLGIRTNTLRAQATKGRLLVEKRGRDLFIREDEVRRYADTVQRRGRRRPDPPPGSLGDGSDLIAAIRPTRRRAVADLLARAAELADLKFEPSSTAEAAVGLAASELLESLTARGGEESTHR